MAKKYVSLNRLSTFLDNIKTIFATKSELSGKADSSHTHSISQVTNLQTTLDGKVPTSRTVNGKALSSNITLSASDVGAATSTHTHDDRYYTETEIDQKLSGKSDTTHNHDSKYDSKGSALAVQTNLDTVSDTLNDHTSDTDIHFTATERTKLSGIAAGAQVNTITGVKGNSESTYRTGNINITKANIGLGNVDNTADANKSVKHATTSDSATSATKATQDASGNTITSTYETKTGANSKLTEAKTYADNAANAVKNDLLNGAGGAYDTLKELGDLIEDNKDAIDALETVASGKANAVHTHAISDVTNLQSALNEKASSTYLKDNYITNTRIVDNLTSSASNYVLSAKQGNVLKGQIDNLNTTVSGKANTSHTHTVANITDLTATATELNYVDGVTSNIQTQLDGKQATISGGASTITSSNLTTNRALVSNGSGKVAVSAVTSTELGYLDGVTSSIQAQIDSKASITDLTTHQNNKSNPHGVTLSQLGVTASATDLNKLQGTLATKAEINYLDGLERNIQDQINDLRDTVYDKVDIYGDTMTGNLIIEPTSTYSPRIQLIGNANASGQQAEASFMKGTNSSVDHGTSIEDVAFDGRKTTLFLHSNVQFDEQKLRLRITTADGNYKDYYIYGEHHKPTATELGVLENSGSDLHDFITERNVMYASNIVGDDVIPFIDVSLKSGRKITMNEFLEYLADNSGMASVSTLTTAEYNALTPETINANTLYMLTDSDEPEYVTQDDFNDLQDNVSQKAAVQIITWESDD